MKNSTKQLIKNDVLQIVTQPNLVMTETYAFLSYLFQN